MERYKVVSVRGAGLDLCGNELERVLNSEDNKGYEFKSIVPFGTGILVILERK